MASAGRAIRPNPLDLNDVIQAAFSWGHSHLWLLDVKRTIYVDRNLIDWEDDSLIDAYEMDLNALVKNGTRKFKYKYDFGDNWIHVISIFKRHPKPQPDLDYPALVAGERASPPEDVGGLWGYEDFLEAIQDPEHPRHDMFSEWVDTDSFDPDQMEEQSIKRRLVKIARYLA